jgi:hypothetical protein
VALIGHLRVAQQNWGPRQRPPSTASSGPNPKAPALPGDTYCRTNPDHPVMKAGNSADYISLLKLVEHVSRSLGPQLATHAIREKWLAGEIRFRVRWLTESPHERLFYAQAPGVAAPHRDEDAPPQFLVDLECRGKPFKQLIGLSEDGIYIGPGKTAYLLASRADAARFWPWDDLYGGKRVTGRNFAASAKSLGTPRPL